ncbi:hypothetical protein JDV02_007271 [Purpureocillium takamizusanense]|uniref:Ubiquitin-like domain-containing protein n=1 Tax=Purpureocillium takamizusanense TaxID=2060973 RepID=A0A9Q8QLD2_9HYPO|nr:uncharacterized protein JDV02_007271 [Purpureocillium takamizusanense]UNI21266.1 hypothetical protein JDV02_007271 [Purpureocillium takamizusanense]
MADLAGTIVGAVSFGLQLATALQTFTVLAIEADDALRDIVFEVNATAAALGQLQTIVDADRAIPDDDDDDAAARSRVLNDSGRHQVQTLALRCEKVYGVIVRLVLKASGSGSSSTGNNNEGGDGGDGNPTLSGGRARAALLDVSTLKPMNVLRRLRWPWLIPRINRCQEQLRWLKISLLVTLQVANLAGQQIRAGEKAASPEDDGDDDDVWARQAIDKLWQRQALLERRAAVGDGRAGDDSARARGRSSKKSDEAMRPRPSAALATDQDAAGSISQPSPLVGNLTNPYARTAASPDWQLGTTSSRHVTGECSPYNESKAAVSVAFVSRGRQHNTYRGESGAVGRAKRYPWVDDLVEPRGSLVRNKTAAQDVKAPWQERRVPWQEHEPELNTPDVTGGKTIRLARGAHSSSSSHAHTGQENRGNVFAQWFPRLAGAGSKGPPLFVKDTPSDDLKAFIVDEQGGIRPVPFGHRNLEYNLTRIVKSHKRSTWTQYLDADAETQALLAKATDSARKTTNHSVALVAFQRLESRPNALVVFYAVTEPLQPVQFTKDVSRRFMVPYGACDTYEEFSRTILALLSDDPRLQRAVRKGSFELRTERGETIHPTLWAGWIQPGAIVVMKALPERSVPDFPAGSSKDGRADEKMPEHSRPVRRPGISGHLHSGAPVEAVRPSSPPWERIFVPTEMASENTYETVVEENKGDETVAENIEAGNVQIAAAVAHARRRRTVLGRLVGSLGSLGTGLSRRRRGRRGGPVQDSLEGVTWMTPGKHVVVGVDDATDDDVASWEPDNEDEGEGAHSDSYKQDGLAAGSDDDSEDIALEEYTKEAVPGTTRSVDELLRRWTNAPRREVSSDMAA